MSWPKQAAFYAEEIGEPEHKVAVIISDALRFEAAQELLSQLHTDEKNAAKMRSRLASLPSVTQVGMGLLLPGEKAWNDRGFMAKGMSTQGTPARDAILKSGVLDAHAVTYDTLEGMTRDERREIFQSKVVYVYHNVIDAIGDKRGTPSGGPSMRWRMRSRNWLPWSSRCTRPTTSAMSTSRPTTGSSSTRRPLADADLADRCLQRICDRVEESTRYFRDAETRFETDLAYCFPVHP